MAPLRDLRVITESNENFTLFSGGLSLLYLDGTGLPPVERKLGTMPMAHGAVDKGFKLLPRPMTLGLAFNSQNVAFSDNLRDQLAYIFGPSAGKLTLVATRDDMEVRMIDCYVNGTVDFPMSTRVGASQNVIVPLIAADPIWYAPDVIETQNSLINGVRILTPITTDMTWYDWPLIDFTGPVAAGSLWYRLPGNLLFEWDTDIPAGQTFRVDPRPGMRKIYRLSNGDNKMSWMNPNYLPFMSVLYVAHPKLALQLDPAWVSASNEFGFSCSGTDGNSYIKITWRKRFLSL